MEETKPQKKLVSKEKFVKIMGQKLTLYYSACAFLYAGLLCLVMTVGALIITLIMGTTDSVPDCRVMFTVLSGLLGVSAAFFLFFSERLFTQSKTIEAVMPITSHNTHLLPQQETLVRSSSTPTAQQEELLRAATLGAETPEEELLRASESR